MSSNDLVLSHSDFTVSFYHEISDILFEWNALVGENLFLHSKFLKALEDAPPSYTRFRYALVKKEDDIIGVVYFQLKRINLYDSLRLDAAEASGFWNRFLLFGKRILARPLKANMLVVGNMTLTGSNGFAFSEKVEKDLHFELAKECAKELVCELKKENVSVATTLIKDFYAQDRPKFQPKAYTQFQVQPNMIIDIDPEWKSFDDYINSMKSKYRVRVRRARKKAEQLERRVLSLEEIHAYSDPISMLYKNVANQAGFNLFILPHNYFYSLQKHLGSDMEIVAYFDQGKMVGYYTYIKNHGDLDAHFLGYDPECNSNCQLYLNMLYDLVDDAIRHQSNKLILSRTAMEIKSSVGAEGHPMYLYLMATNSILNLGASKALSYFKPDTSWVPRSPFK